MSLIQPAEVGTQYPAILQQFSLFKLNGTNLKIHPDNPARPIMAKYKDAFAKSRSCLLSTDTTK